MSRSTISKRYHRILKAHTAKRQPIREPEMEHRMHGNLSQRSQMRTTLQHLSETWNRSTANTYTGASADEQCQISQEARPDAG